MKALIITQDLSFFEEDSISRRWLLKLSKTLDAVHVAVFNTRKEKQDVIKLADNVWVYPTNSWHAVFFPWSMKHLITSQVVWKRELIVDFIIATDLDLSGGVAQKISAKYDVPFYLDMHGDQYEIFDIKLSDFVLVRKVNSVIESSVGIRVTFEQEKAALLKINPKFEKKITVMSEYLDLGEIDNSPIKNSVHSKYPSLGFTVLAILDNSIKHGEDLKDFLIAISNSMQMSPKVGMICLGAGKHKTYYQSLARSILLGQVFFEEGYENMNDYMRTANVVLLPKIYNSKNLVIKSIASGCPVISTDYTEVKDLIVDGETGYVCDDKTENCISRSIMQVMRKNNMRDAIKISGRFNLFQQFSETEEQYMERYIHNIVLGIQAMREKREERRLSKYQQF